MQRQSIGHPIVFTNTRSSPPVFNAIHYVVSLFGLAGKGPWGRITHSEYVIRRYGLHLMTGGEDRVL